MIAFRKLTLARAGRPLIVDANIQLHAGQRVGIIGPNGCGKSSLFAMLLGELHQEAGDLEIPPGWVIAEVAQETTALDKAAIEHVLDGDAELRLIEAQMRDAELAHDGERIALAHDRYDTVGGYAARSRAESLLAGLGFAAGDLERPVASFSGGWRVRLNLARALMCRSDLLLLDEPTNHLDLDAVVWLEAWLRSYPGTLLVISHDREFLDNAVSHILHVDNRSLRLYRGAYSAFEEQRAARLVVQQASFEAQQREIAALTRFIERFRAKATKARQAQSRAKSLARMETLAPVHFDAPFHFSFIQPAASPDMLLVLEKVAIGYPDREVLGDVELVLRAGARVALLGRNGVGKSSLIKVLAGSMKALRGERREGKGLTIGYFAQHQVEQLRPDESPLQHLMRLDPRAREQDLRDYLGGFDFRGDGALAAVGPFSGGEKSRLALALIIWQRPNLLLLDEPTNHLDMEMRYALTLALQSFEGAVVLVSHDRHLLRTTVDDFLLVAEGKVRPFDGDLDDYANWLQTGAAPEPLDEPSERGPSKREARQQSAQRRADLAQRRRPLERELKALDAALAAFQSEKSALDRSLADESLYLSDARETVQLKLVRQAEVGRAIDEAETRWLQVHERLEAMD